MSGIQTGTRLERLERLDQQLHLEIRQERIRLALETPKQPASWRKPPTRRPANPAGDRCLELGVTPLQVKQWAVHVGILESVKRGRLELSIVEAYAARPRIDP